MGTGFKRFPLRFFSPYFKTRPRLLASQIVFAPTPAVKATGPARYLPINVFYPLLPIRQPAKRARGPPNGKARREDTPGQKSQQDTKFSSSGA